MSKAAAKRKLKRKKYLSSLAQRDPVAFEREWEKRLSSWLREIERNAGVLKNREGKSVAPVFKHVDEALDILEACGNEIFKKYAPRTYEILANECCRQFAIKVDSCLFHINTYRQMESIL